MPETQSTYIITLQEGQVLSFLIDAEGKTQEIHADDPHGAGEKPGDVYAARVEKVMPGLGAAFICYAPGRTGYLQLDSCSGAVMIRQSRPGQIRQGDELIVQLSKLNAPPKRPIFTARIELAGTFAVAGLPGGCNIKAADVQAGSSGDGSPGSGIKTTDVPAGSSGSAPAGVSVSRKLDPEARSRLKEQVLAHLQEAQPGDTACSVVIRTNAASASAEELFAEIDSLCGRLSAICSNAMHRTIPCPLSIADVPWLERLRGLPVQTTGKIVADARTYETVRDYLQEHQPLLAPALVRYDDPMIGIRALYSLDTRLEEALGRKVWLRSGGFLVIEQTEALVSIDVNTGKGSSTSRKMSREQQYLETNLEAAQEIARQVRVRGLSGIIIADFINMEEESSRAQVLEQLAKALALDPVPCSRPDFTRLGLVEFTRRRREKSLAMILNKR